MEEQDKIDSLPSTATASSSSAPTVLHDVSTRGYSRILLITPRSECSMTYCDLRLQQLSIGPRLTFSFTGFVRWETSGSPQYEALRT